MLILIFILIFFFILCIGIIYLSYYIPKKIGYPKIGKILSSLLIIFVTYLTIIIFFEEELFTKNDAKKEIAALNFNLNDDFTLIQNKSMAGFGEYLHFFKLSITPEDKLRLIKEIQNSTNYNNSNVENFTENRDDYYFGPKRIKNYETEEYYIREYFKPNGKNYSPTWLVLKIEKRGNLIIYEDIDN
jgi:hypothetical protein